jgi:hypothetical protein
MDEYNISQILAELELELVRNLTESVKSDLFKAGKLQALREYRERNKKILSKYKITKEVEQALKQAYSNGGTKVQAEIQKARVQSKFAGNFSLDDGKLNALIKASTKDFNNAQIAILRMMDDVYRKTLYKTQVALSADIVSMDEAIDKATKSFLDQGINCIEYSDGRRVNIATWAEMALRTSTRRAVLAGEGSMRDKWGIYTVKVSRYGACSPTCLPWQGRVYIDDVYSGGKSDGTYPLLSVAIQAGLFHPNCRHRLSTWFEGINRPDEPYEDTREVYAHEQEQRYNERQIRKYKRLAEGSVSEKNKTAYQIKVRQWQAKQRELMKKYPNELRRDYSREQVR